MAFGIEDMRNLISGIEIVSLFNPKVSLKQLRDEGMPCIMLSGKYWYNYSEVVRWLM